MPRIAVCSVGVEHEPIAVIDDFAVDPDALRAAAVVARFEPGRHHYPGLRADLPPAYLRDQAPAIVAALAQAFGHHGRIDIIDASFSIVTTPPADLSVPQRLPHCDAFARTRIALLHYLSPDDEAGTAFFRHRATGYETVDGTRAPTYHAALDTELRANPPPAAYIAGDTALFERTALIEFRYNRALLYRSYILHSGAIPADAPLPSDPATGRLTVTGFLSIG